MPDTGWRYLVSGIEYQEMDYSKTLNLPETSFPMKCDPAEIEHEVLSIWKDLSIYERRQRSNKGKSKFIVHNPPRFAYGHVCIDDALNMILKDIIVKYRLMRGFDAPHFPSWNCYTSAVEREALQLLEGDETAHASEVRQSEVRKRCRSLCSEYIAVQKEQFQRLGIFAYWDKAVLNSGSSMGDPAGYPYESRMIEAFGELYEAGYLHKGAKPTRWCINCQTDLAETETEYRDHELLSLYVKFPVLHGLEELGEDVYIVVWTNMPWTLPANTAITVHPDHDYVAVEHTLQENSEILIMAAGAVEDAIRVTANGQGKKGTNGKGEYRVIKKMKGLKLDEIVYAHPLLDRDSGVLLDRRVSLARGTGCVHAVQAKACHSTGSAAIGRQRDPEIISAVDQNGQLTEETGQFCGLNVFESGDPISLELEKRGCLLVSEPMKQPYPHCSYCKKPIIVRVADKWIFDLNASNLRQRVLEGMEDVDWFPDWSKDRISHTIAKRSDWGVSRRRIWGIPTPVFYCSKCNSQVNILEGIELSRNMINRKGVNRWLTARPSDIFSEDVICDRCGGRDFRWETDILDTEFISAMSYKAIPPKEEEGLSRSADICLGSDGQNEKWFQFSLLPAMAIEGSPPFRSALIHGSVVDEDGKRIPYNVSRSEDGASSIQDLLDEFGADILRFWATSMDCKKHLRMSYSCLELVSKIYRRIRNICRFLLGNLSGYDPESDRLDYTYLQEVDRWALHRLAKFTDATTRAFEDCHFHLFYRLLHNFCSVDISSIYLNMVRRRLYTFPRWSSSRRAVQTVIYEILISLTRLVAPVLSFVAEEIWRHIPGVREDCPSVYLSHWPNVNEDFLNDELESRWNYLLRIRAEMRKLLEKIRQKEGISGSSQASIILYASSPDVYDLLDRYIDDLEAIFMVSKVRLMPPDAPVPDGIWESDSIEGLAIEIRRATGEKCERCWIYSDTVGTNDQYPTLCYQCIAILEGGTYYV